MFVYRMNTFHEYTVMSELLVTRVCGQRTRQGQLRPVLEVIETAVEGQLCIETGQGRPGSYSVTDS